MNMTYMYVIALWAAVIACSMAMVCGIKFLFSRYFKKEIKGSKFFILLVSMSGVFFGFIGIYAAKKFGIKEEFSSVAKIIGIVVFVTILVPIWYKKYYKKK